MLFLEVFKLLSKSEFIQGIKQVAKGTKKQHKQAQAQSEQALGKLAIFSPSYAIFIVIFENYTKCLPKLALEWTILPNSVFINIFVI